MRRAVVKVEDYVKMAPLVVIVPVCGWKTEIEMIGRDEGESKMWGFVRMV